MGDYWKEIEAASASASSARAEEFLVPTNKTLIRRVRTGAAWVWTFAGLSAANLVLSYLDGPIRMVVSFFVTELAFVLGRQIHPIAVAASLIFSGFVIGAAFGLGFLIRGFRPWACVAAIVGIAIDAIVIFLFASLFAFWPLALHAAAIYFLVLAYRAAKLHQERKAKGQV